MTRLWVAVTAAILLAAMALVLVRPDSDATKVLGRDGDLSTGLDTPTGRAMAIAVIGPDRDLRTVTAQAVVDMLRTDPMVSSVNDDPSEMTALLDWIWTNRLALAPPPTNAATVKAMVAELTHAVEAFDSFADARFAPRFLLDPTGSFRSILSNLQSVEPDLTTHNGISQAKDDSAALIFATLAATPFNVADQSALNTRIQSVIASSGHQALILGPRPISARISAHISRRATVSAGIATLLLVAWLIWLTRSAIGLLRVLLPIAIGASVAALAIQNFYGTVHILALGFGGALIGLAIDYPIHLISHSGSANTRRSAIRWILLGAVSTAIAFLATLVTGIEALSQIGLFVAIGLLTAAGVCLWFAPGFQNMKLHGPGWHPPSLRFPAPIFVLASIAIIAAAILWARPSTEPSSLIRIPSHVKDDITRMGQMQDLPSGRITIQVIGTDLTDILRKQTRLKPVLIQAATEKTLARWRMLVDLLPFQPRQHPTPPEVFDNLTIALDQAGLATEFAAKIEASYSTAYNTASDPQPIPAKVLEVSGLGTLIQQDGNQLIGSVHLWGITDPGTLSALIERLDEPGIQVIDAQSRISESLDNLTRSVLNSLGIGAVLALGFLVLFRRDAPQIAIATGAATAATALIINETTGTLGIFQIVALVLVTGIGIDYGLFLRNDEDERAFKVAASSVTRCAVTTLIAFITMAFSGVTVLQNIGMTVSIGVLAMLAAHLLRAPKGIAK